MWRYVLQASCTCWFVRDVIFDNRGEGPYFQERDWDRGKKKTLREMLRHRPRLGPKIFTTITAQAAT